MKISARKMKKLTILKFGNPILRQTAKPVTVFHSKLHSMIDALADTLHSRDDGAALAAPQVGLLKRVVVIDYLDEYLELINPEIVLADGQTQDYEGCLSFPGFIGKVPRANHIKLKYLDRFGNEKLTEREGAFARCIQHELDHLDGVLFIDRMNTDYLLHNENKTKISLKSALDLADGKLQGK